MIMMMMTVISVSSEAAVEELRRLLLLLLGCAVQVITHSTHFLKVDNDTSVVLLNMRTTSIFYTIFSSNVQYFIFSATLVVWSIRPYFDPTLKRRVK